MPSPVARLHTGEQQLLHVLIVPQSKRRRRRSEDVLMTLGRRRLDWTTDAYFRLHGHAVLCLGSRQQGVIEVSS